MLGGRTGPTVWRNQRGKVLASALFCFLLLSETATTAQTEGASEPSADEIVVTGSRPLAAEEFDRAVTAFVRERGQAGPINQISRWGGPVCAKTEGLAPGMNAFVTRRVQEIATRVGAHGPGDCAGRTNVWVAFTPEPERLMADIREKQPWLLGYHFVGQRDAVAAFEPPMKSWYVTLTTIPGHYAAVDHAYGPGPPAGSGSRIRLPYKSRFGFVVVVIDSDWIEGQTIGPVADKVAVLALSNPGKRQGCSPLPSVLDLLEPDCSRGADISGLTAYDEAYLTGLYAFDQDELKGYMRDTIAAHIKEELGPP